ncbi:MAG: glucosamine-6-phosphate deaminase [Cyclobacteriaceae bacterium]|nr:MAG: glucosamine-6-phosphate deaminase [Cyclobacteriaceae bacterium]
MNTIISRTKQELGQKAAGLGSRLINEAIASKGSANIIVATGASQFEMLAELVGANIPWSKVTGFHLDEYIGLPITHQASFRKYLKERFVGLVNPAGFHFVDGEGDSDKECKRLGEIISRHPIDVAFVGIGENGHLAFNDPPADFETKEPFIIVDLDEDCRRQQLNEGWFNDLTEVPKQAISMSIHQIMLSRHIICSVPDSRKAAAVSKSLHDEVSPAVPASILQQHPSTYFFLDQESASLIAT